MRRLAGKIEPCGLAAKKRDKLFMYDLDHLLGRVQVFCNLNAEATLSHPLDKIFDNLEVDVRFQKREPYFAQAFLNVGFIKLRTTAEFAEDVA